MMMDTNPEALAVEAVRIAAHMDGYGPLFEVTEIDKGHPLYGPNSLCPKCGRLQINSPVDRANRETYEDGLIPWSILGTMCFDYAEFIVEFTYNDQGHRALYGVPAEGMPSCWMS